MMLNIFSCSYWLFLDLLWGNTIQSLCPFLNTGAKDRNPSYPRGGDWENCSLRLAQAKSSQDHISTNGHVWRYSPIIPACWGSMNRTAVLAHPSIKPDPISKITNAKRGVAQVVHACLVNVRP
jgi:hypothetical protein